MALILHPDQKSPDEEPLAVGPVLFPGADLDWKETGGDTSFPVETAGTVLRGYLGHHDGQFLFCCTHCSGTFCVTSYPSARQPIYALPAEGPNTYVARVLCRPCAAARPEEWPA